MGEQPERRDPKLARTDFESMTHEQLAAMLDGASSTGASHLSSKLSTAASTITKIGDDLMKHVKSLEWQGQAGDTFRDWGGHAASAALHLGQYAEVASRWMGTVSQAIAEAKAAMPETSETAQAKKDLADAHSTIAAARAPGAHNDPDARKLAQTAQTDATTAQKRIDAARGEAIQQMRKLAQTYEYSAQQVNSVQPPTFSPPAGKTGSNSWWVGEDQHVSSGSAYAGTGTPRGAAQAVHTGGTGVHPAVHTLSPAVPGQVHPNTSGHYPEQPKPVEMGIDSTDTLQRTPTSGPPAPTGTGMPHRDLPLAEQPTVMPPVSSNGGREPVPNSPGRLPASSRLPQVPRIANPTGNLPRMPRETGIVGGRPVNTPGRATNGLPRGTVIGKENVQGRTSMGRGISPGSPVAEGTRSGSSSVGGRRLASESGGVVGSRQGQPGRTSGRPFTPGGSGLLRSSRGTADATPGSTTGRMGATNRATASKKAQQESQRPDYLVEDEETWTPVKRQTPPPVVD